MAERADEREVVLNILVDRERHHTYSNVLIREALDGAPYLTDQERAFVKRLAEGTIERQIELDSVIRRYLRNPKAEIKPVVRCTLRMAVYEIYYMDSVSDYAACNEAVNLLKKCHQEKAAGFANAVLRQICRDKKAAGTVTVKNGSTVVVAGKEDVFTAPDGKKIRRVVKKKESSQAGRAVSENAPLSVRYSMPEEIVKLWTDAYGKERTERLLSAMLQVRPVCIRMSLRLTQEERKEEVSALEGTGVQVTPAKWLPYCYNLTHVRGVASLPGFSEGIFTVQDESSALACEAAGAAECQNILDLCAAPGGKSLLLAERAKEGTVYSFDLTKNKTDRIRENAARMHVNNIVIEEHDATQYDPALKEKMDLVFCDLPCSGMGVMTKKRDIRYSVTPEKIRSLVTLQKKILRNAAAYVRPGGVLLYSTCTIDPLENEKIASWIRRELDLAPDDLSSHLPAGIPGVSGNMLQLFPDVHDTDGFFMARFKKL